MKYFNLIKTNKKSTFHFQEPWNPSGTNIFNENWPFPIFMVDNEVTIKFLREDCFENFNKPDETTKESRDWPLCAVELMVSRHCHNCHISLYFYADTTTVSLRDRSVKRLNCMTIVNLKLLLYSNVSKE